MRYKNPWLVFALYVFIMLIAIPYIIGRALENNKCLQQMNRVEIEKQMLELKNTFSTMDR